MDYQATSGHLAAHKNACLLLAVYEDKKLTPSATEFNQITKGLLLDLYKRGDVTGEKGSSLVLPSQAGMPFDRVVLVGCGKEASLKDSDFRKILNGAWQALKNTPSKNVIWTLGELDVQDRDMLWKCQQTVYAVEQNTYEFRQLKTVTATQKPSKIARITFLVDSPKSVGPVELLVQETLAITRAMTAMKNLANLPANICTPTYLAKHAKQLAKNYAGLKATALGLKEIEKLGMGSFLSVCRGSEEPPQFIILEYRGTQKAKKPLVLVGKGITFDSGGISIKPSNAMDEMKYDMCGAATVLGALQAIAELKLPINVVGLIAATENLPSGSATKPGDIVKSMSGLTVEVLNTDAEGRLVLADALTYAERYKPELVIDIATLTGAVVVALGDQASGLISNNDHFARELLAAGEYAGDRLWQLPLWDEYQEVMDSPFADVANISNKSGAGTITGACFLARFAKHYPWMHLDIAGTAWVTGKNKGATARPLPALMQFILNRCHH